MLEMLGGYTNLKCANSEDIKFEYLWYEEGPSGTPIDLSGYTGYMSIFDSSGVEVLDCDAFITIADNADDNNIRIFIPVANVQPVLDVGDYVFDLVITDGTYTTRMLYGDINIIAGYTVIP